MGTNHQHYAHFITPGKILAEIYRQIRETEASKERKVKKILRFLILSQLDEQQYTKLEQAGSASDSRPGIHELFIDLPFICREFDLKGLVLNWLIKTASKCHRFDEEQLDTEKWRIWSTNPSRARVWFIKGGPGHGKSTISQFFCQIQRAALILNKELHNTPRKKKGLATEIREAVQEKFNFWPSVPRIPISLELREFAQWFGQRDKNQPRGILTYLAESIISAGIEEKVTAEILKQILEIRSWLVVFDGLDEVPQDVKDAVAREVCYFVNDVTLDIDADILTICTSRPQGYSGQFEDLDGSIIELTSLSPKQALECATPVLKLGRSESDAKKSIQILTSAIESPAVRELMTTPLQSHIMAVVVRDGERPPERKWKLFSNFYQVIKRREANRDLPDKKLANLLREQDQLLKTVHNRLGFILQAKAESSKGAQTKLDKDEFKKLVTDAVYQMVETEVDETVHILMKATTDRLVLVSTPDDGNHVRFDIRQLQEFFAAEFLYESVDADQLRERLELIAGDAHWREVMHFLLSALIENNRKTELTVAVEVLENLNEGDEDNLRLLKRRLGRGAILAARLLQEGVLEQDRRTRQQFRKCLDPLTASTDVELLKTLVEVNQPNSKAWLRSFLISCLEEKQLTENIGAVVILVQILPEDDDKIEEVTQFILSSPIKYISCLLATLKLIHFEYKINRDYIPVTKWFLKSVIQIIVSSKWISLTEKAFDSALELISHNHEESCNIAQELGFSLAETKLFKILLNPRQELFSDSSIATTSKDYEFIKITVTCSQANLTKKYSDIEFLSDFDNIPNIFQILYLLIRLNQQKIISDLTDILGQFKSKNSNLLKPLISYLGNPINFVENVSLEEEIQCLKNMSQKDFEEIYYQNKNYFKLSDFRIESLNQNKIQKINSNNFKELINDYPILGIMLLMDGIIRSKENEKEILKIIADKSIKTPKTISRYPSIWGLLTKSCPERESELRRAFLLKSSEKIDDDSRERRFKFHPLKVSLPSEATLLPHLVNSLLINTKHFSGVRDIYLELNYSRKLVTEIVNNTSELEQISNDLQLNQNIRASATIMLMLHPDGNKKLEDIKQLLIELYTSEVSLWHIKTVTTCLCLLATEEQPTAQWIINTLLEKVREDYESREHFQKLLNLWRESSYAPIQKKGAQEKWLSKRDA